MKKFILLSLAFVSMVSCDSQDNNSLKNDGAATVMVSKSSDSEFSELDREYKEILSSPEFSEVITLLNNFNNKIENLDFYEIEDRNYLLTLIEKNINKTGFKNRAEAEIEYDVIINKYSTLFVKNESFYTKVSQLKEINKVKRFANIEGYYNPNLIKIPIPGGDDYEVKNCKQNCLTAMALCSNEAQQVYEEKLASAILLGSVMAPVGVGMAANAYFERQAADRRCAREGVACVDNCGKK